MSSNWQETHMFLLLWIRSSCVFWWTPLVLWLTCALVAALNVMDSNVKKHDLSLLGSAQCPLTDKRHTCFYFCEYVHLVFFMNPSGTLADVRFGGCIEYHAVKCKIMILSFRQRSMSTNWRETHVFLLLWIRSSCVFWWTPLILWLTCALVAALNIMDSNVKIMFFFFMQRSMSSNWQETHMFLLLWIHSSCVFFDEPFSYFGLRVFWWLHWMSWSQM